MKDNLLTRSLGIAVIIGLIFVTAFLIVLNSQRAIGSVTVGNEYTATTTDSNWSANSCKQDLVKYKSLGSVIVTLTSNAPLEIYDATTTGPHADHATTSVAMFKTTTVGNYTFDVGLKRGLCVVGASTVGVASTTITTR